MNYGYIYKTTNLINGRIYIGQKQGTFTHEYLGSGIIIKKAIKRYGRENFLLEVIAFATTKSILDGLEKKYIYEYRQVFGKEFLYNITDGGYGPNGYKHTDKTKSIISAKNSGQTRTLDAKNKMSISNKEYLAKHPRKWSEETKQKIRDKRKLQVFTDDDRRKMREGWERRRRLSKSVNF